MKGCFGSKNKKGPHWGPYKLIAKAICLKFGDYLAVVFIDGRDGN